MKRIPFFACILFVFLAFAVMNNVSASGNATPLTPVYISGNDKTYHRDFCTLLGENRTAIPLGNAISRGYSPCAYCHPPQLSEVSVNHSQTNQSTSENSNGLILAWLSVLFICGVILAALWGINKKNSGKLVVYMFRGVLIFIWLFIPASIISLLSISGTIVGGFPTLLIYAFFIYLIYATFQGKIGLKIASKSCAIENDYSPSPKQAADIISTDNSDNDSVPPQIKNSCTKKQPLIDRRTYVEDTLIPQLFYQETQPCINQIVQRKESFLAELFNTKHSSFSNNEFTYRPSDFRLWVIPNKTRIIFLVRMPTPVRPPQCSYLAAVVNSDMTECNDYVTVELTKHGDFFLCRQDHNGCHMILEAECGSTPQQNVDALMSYLGVNLGSASGQQTTHNLSYLSVFSEIYEKALYILKQQAIVSNVEFELIPAMYVIADIACLNSEKDRERIIRGLLAYIQRTFGFDEGNNACFDARVAIYGDVICGMELRADWLLGQSPTDIANANSAVRCSIALGDILINPDCGKNYRNAPSRMYSALDIFEFSDAMLNQILPLFAEFYNRIYELNL